MNDVRIFQYGCGKMAPYIMRYAIDKGYKIVGGADINEEVIGMDIGTLMNSEELGIKVSSVENIEEKLIESKANMCIVTTMSLLNDVKDILLTCAKLGINVITTCEEAFYPMNSNPVLTKEIDALAKGSNCTITGSGYQDAFWGNLISTMAGATYKIDKIKGSSSYNVEDYGIALANAHGAGLTLEEFDKQIAQADNISAQERQKLIENSKFIPSYMWNVNGWLCDKLGLTVLEQTQKCIPQTHSDNIESSTLKMCVKAGTATGMSAVVTTTTKEGITIEAECIGKVYSKEDCDKNIWEVIGEPTTKMVIEKPNTVELTCATVVNRVEDVIKCEAGFVPTSRMGELKYLK